MIFTRPTWAEIARGPLLRNYRLLRALAGPGADLLAVVKANGYGHGGPECARLLAAAQGAHESAHEGAHDDAHESAHEGAAWFGVTSLEEALPLRAACPGARILAMSGLFPGEADTVIEQRVTPVVWQPEHLDLLQAAAQRRGLRAGRIPVHLEVDTGMSRQGIQPGSLPAFLERLGPDSPLRLEAVTTHFHSADSPDPAPTRAQIREFAVAVDTILRCGLRPEWLSAGSSASLLQQDTETVTDLARRAGARRMLRAGIALYGYPPRQENATPAPAVAPVLAWKTRVISLRAVEEGAVAGYDATFRARRPSRLALLPVGYADGLNRLLSNRGSVLVRGRRAPIAGRISMDQTMVDVTDIPGVSMGDEVVLIGEQGEAAITAAELAALTGTIPYEVLCAIAARVPRVMVD